MKKNGFTLIELIATIGLLGMLATILITVSVKKINETKEHSKKTMIESIELAAKEYVTDYKDELSGFQNNDYIYISLQTLVEKNYFSNSLIDPTTNKSLPLTDTVYVTREQNGEINATYDINQKQKAKITLNGSYNEYIKEGTTFTDLGVNAVSSNGTNISSSITTTGTVDTTTPGTYKIKYEYRDISIERNVIVYEGNLPSEIKIPVFINYYANEGTFGTTKYEYTGGEQTFIVPNDGYYMLEVWGAQGGTANGKYIGGYGGYSVGLVNLKKNQEIYINVGGSGTGGYPSTSYEGGYNGGGSTGVASTTSRYVASGGGATHMASVSGKLSTLSESVNNILIVAGGGGGGYQHTSAGYNGVGGSGGGYLGVNGTKGSSGGNHYGTGGSQTAGGTAYNNTSYGVAGFGYGGVVGSGLHGSSGGGGYYGGGGSAGISGSSNSSGGGGSGYIGNSLLTYKYMYCYNCATSNETNTKTYTTTNVSDTPISNYAKSGNGAAIITQITYEQKSLYSSTYPINDIPVPTREGYTFIGWFTEPVGGTQVTSSTIINNQNTHEIYAHWQAS